MIENIYLSFLNLVWIDPLNFGTLVVQFTCNLLVTIFLIGFVYYPRSKDKNNVFTFITLNTLVFFITHLLLGVDMEVGVAFGLFALFSIVRFRTLPLAVKEMTYLFAVIATGMANSIGTKSLEIADVIFMNFAIVGVIYILDAVFFKRTEMISTITYEKIENIKPQNRLDLVKDLSERTGLIIDKVSVGKINFLNDTARVKIYYSLDKNPLLSEANDYFDDPSDTTTTPDDEKSSIRTK